MTSQAFPRATMRDVADAAGVSLKTVSRVVNREPGVSDLLREKVDAAAAALEYRHNRAASDLRRGARTGSIGVLVQDVANDFCAQLLRAVELRARDHGVVVLAASIDGDEARERALVSDLVSRRADGIVLMPSGEDQSYVLPDHAAGLAVVLVDRVPAASTFDSVTIDNRGATATAVAHLLALGHRRIGFVGDDLAILTARERRAGYLESLEAAGVPPDASLVAVATTRDEAIRAALDLVDRGATALFAGQNTIAEGCVMALQERELQHAIALVSFDEVPMGTLVRPGLSVVRQDVSRIGTTATDLLLARLGGDRGPAIHEVVPTTFVPRGSGEIAPADTRLP